MEGITSAEQCSGLVTTTLLNIHNNLTYIDAVLSTLYLICGCVWGDNDDNNCLSALQQVLPKRGLKRKTDTTTQNSACLSHPAPLSRGD